MSQSQCVCCEASAFEPHLKGLVRCTNCSHVWADTRLSDEELTALYDRSYFQGQEYLDYAREEPALRENFRRRLRDIARYCPDAETLWEVGAAYGYFLSEAAKTFRSVAGCDVSEFAATQARDDLGVDVRTGDYLSIELEQPVNVVCLWDVVEHLRQPQLVLKKAFRDLSPGGVLVLSTGDIGSLAARLRGENWRLIHPPTHLHYFTRKSLRCLLSRIGFENVHMRYHAFWRSADAVAFRLLSNKAAPTMQKTYRMLTRSGILNFSFPLNTFDIVTLYANKRRS